VTEADTVDLLVNLIEKREPFCHVRFGDGDVMYATGTGSKITGDGEKWTPHLQQRMIQAWLALCKAREVRLLVGDVESYDVSDGVEAEWRVLLQVGEWVRGEPIQTVHIEALRCSRPYASLAYDAIRNDDRHKLYVAPERLAPVAKWLRAKHIVAPLHNAHQNIDQIAEKVDVAPMPKVLLVSAGRGGKILQSHFALTAPDMTQIDIGSGLDMLIPDGVRRGTDLSVNRNQVVAEYRELGWGQ
jgi:hypothetical protein